MGEGTKDSIFRNDRLGPISSDEDRDIFAARVPGFRGCILVMRGIIALTLRAPLRSLQQRSIAWDGLLERITRSAYLQRFAVWIQDGVYDIIRNSLGI